VADFPRAHFRASQVRRVRPRRYVLVGELTLRDVTRPVEWEVRLEGDVEAESLRATATTQLRRSDFGLLREDQVRDAVELVVEARLRRAGAPRR
jgi:polyisoprenoid-binding protein YceI